MLCSKFYVRNILNFLKYGVIIKGTFIRRFYVECSGEKKLLGIGRLDKNQMCFSVCLFVLFCPRNINERNAAFALRFYELINFTARVNNEDSFVI